MMTTRKRPLSTKRQAFADAYRGPGDGVRAAREAHYHGGARALSIRAVEALRDVRVRELITARGVPLPDDIDAELLDPIAKVPSVTDPREFFEATIADESQPWDRRQKAAERLEQINRRDAPDTSAEATLERLRTKADGALARKRAREQTPLGSAQLLVQVAGRAARADVRDVLERAATELGALPRGEEG